MNERDSFVFYREWYEIVTNCDERTQLSMYRAIMDYVFLGTLPTDPALQLVFPLIKIRLDSDSAKWADVKEKRRQAINSRWEKHKSIQMNTNEYKCIQTDTKEYKPIQADTNDTVYVNVYGYKDTNVSMDTIEKEISLTRDKEKEVATVVATPAKGGVDEKIKAFYDELIPYVSVYGKEMVRDFFEYWTEKNESGTQFRKQREKTWNTSRRLRMWAKQENKFGKYGCNTSNQSTPQQRANDVAELIARLGAKNKPFEG